MLPTHQTSIAQLPTDLRGVIRETVCDYRLLMGGKDVALAGTRFSWFENGELLTCRVTVRTCADVTDQTGQLVVLGVLITDEHGRRNLINADAFRETWGMVAGLGYTIPHFNGDEFAEVTLPLAVLMR